MLEHFKWTAVIAAVSICTACIIATDDDDGASDSTSGDDSSNNADDANNEDAGEGSGNGDAGEDTGPGSGSADTGQSTGGAGSCGWGQTGEDVVAEGYLCGGDGEDPEDMHPIGCPPELTLEPGAACTDESAGAEITGVGCCGPDGNAWFCAEPDDGGGPQLFTETCS